MLFPVYYAFTGCTTLFHSYSFTTPPLSRSTVSDTLRVPVIPAPYIPLTFKYLSIQVPSLIIHSLSDQQCNRVILNRNSLKDGCFQANLLPIFCGNSRFRPYDLSVNSALLYQLSYIPIVYFNFSLIDFIISSFSFLSSFCQVDHLILIPLQPRLLR